MDESKILNINNIFATLQADKAEKHLKNLVMNTEWTKEEMIADFENTVSGCGVTGFLSVEKFDDYIPVLVTGDTGSKVQCINQNLAIKYFNHLIETLDQPVYGQVANAQFIELNKGLISKWKNIYGKLFYEKWVIVPDLPVGCLASHRWLNKMGWKLDSQLPPDTPLSVVHSAESDLNLSDLEDMCHTHVKVLDNSTQQLQLLLPYVKTPIQELIMAKTNEIDVLLNGYDDEEMSKSQIQSIFLNKFVDKPTACEAVEYCGKMVYLNGKDNGISIEEEKLVNKRSSEIQLLLSNVSSSPNHNVLMNYIDNYKPNTLRFILDKN